MNKSYSLEKKPEEKEKPITISIEKIGPAVFLAYSGIKGIIKGVRTAAGINNGEDIIESEFHKFITTYSHHFLVFGPLFGMLYLYNSDKFSDKYKKFQSGCSPDRNAVRMSITIPLFGASLYGAGYLAGTFLYNVFS